MKKIVLLSVAMALTPFVAFAQNLGYFNAFVAQINGLITAAVPVVIGIAILLFLWGLATYMLSENEDKRADARSLMIWGVVIIFVMLALWGLVALLATIVGVSTTGAPAGLGPQLPA